MAEDRLTLHHVTLSSKELEDVEKWRQNNRFPETQTAIREIVRIGLSAEELLADRRQKIAAQLDGNDDGSG